MRVTLGKRDKLVALVGPLVSVRESGARGGVQVGLAFLAWTTTLINHKIHHGGIREKPSQTISSTALGLDVASITVAGRRLRVRTRSR